MFISSRISVITFLVYSCLAKKLNRALIYQEYCLVISSSERLNWLSFCIAISIIVWGILYLLLCFYCVGGQAFIELRGWGKRNCHILSAAYLTFSFPSPKHSPASPGTLYFLKSLGFFFQCVRTLQEFLAHSLY